MLMITINDYDIGDDIIHKSLIMVMWMVLMMIIIIENAGHEDDQSGVKMINAHDM